jgi:type I restriction enzyme M protein
MADTNLSSFIWSVADLLRGDYRAHEYGEVILPFTVLRRLDCVLEPTKAAVLQEKAKREKAGLNPEPFLLRKAAASFYNTSPLTLKKLIGDQDNIGVRAPLHLLVADLRLRQYRGREAGHVLPAPAATAGLRPGARHDRPLEGRPHPPQHP